ncbi:TIGR03009 family protein [Neorhodopirellula lusitana]|uniref:TIGR03009 family protein n=1 Tax=Neorhodopirellula lusitana TaxID=445327 RepID=A0ABY1Q2H6_9BACT|nr:TIGR03009 domain-containing protein [Neorhodopirellula lusitana]SMP56131.1 TIGR03009 family protein [Neorhodopirellula lusitana]
MMRLSQFSQSALRLSSQKRVIVATLLALVVGIVLLPASRVAAQQAGVPGGVPPVNPNAAPFAPLSAAEQQRLDAMLTAWETQSNGTKTLECQFQRWHYDLFAAPAGVHAEKSRGVIKYASPDRGLFKVDQKLTFDGMKEGKPQYSEKPGQFGEHWVCNGEELLEFDHSKKECKIQQLPPDMRGQKIFESPLPFVFNLDAKQIKERYWVRQVQAPKPGMMLIEAYPKRQEDRAQYKLVQIALSQDTFLPEALLMYAPNFNIKTAPKWDHYEFVDIKRNSISQGLLNRFMKTFIDEKPPTDWKVFRNAYHPPGPPQMAERPTAQPLSNQR